MILLIEFFIPTSEERYKEYLHCLEENIKNDFISKIVLLISDESVCPLESDKIISKKLEKRPTYTDIFNICNDEYNNEICIVSNSDIIFDRSLGFIHNDNINNKFLALNRWDIKGDTIQRFRHNIGDSQDCWIFKSPVNIPNADFTMGRLGCDNRITYLAHEAGLEVKNPSEQIITKHLHTTEYRTVSKDQSETVWGMHLIVPAIQSIDHPQPLMKRDWPKR
jgi:hypothetical protein